MRLLRYLLSTVALLSLIAGTLFFTVAPAWLESGANAVTGDKGAAPSDATAALHESLIIGDLHADTSLWNRPIASRGDRGQVDLPRLLDGNIALQMFTTVTKSPRGQNLHRNSAAAGDNITLLAIAQQWPVETYTSLLARALYQAERIRHVAATSPAMQLIRTREDLEELLAAREQGARVVGALLGTEGSHALEGELDSIDVLFDAGFRMMSLQHFFDNELGGSLHGETQGGLSQFGEQAVAKMLASNIMIDVSHSSEAVVLDVLTRTDRGLIVSHTGFHGHCQSERNISDATMRKIAEGGGLIGVGFWRAAVCEQSVGAIADAIVYGIETFGLEHIALGSDWDGSVVTPIDASQIARLTQALVDRELSPEQIHAVMGGNMLAFLRQQLPSR